MRSNTPTLHRALLAIVAMAWFTPTVSGAQQRMPSDVLHDIVRRRLENIRWTPVQAESALKPMLRNVRTTNLAPDEDVALALAFFFTFDGGSAKPIFEKHSARDDALGRVSSQSLQQMSFFGAKDYALVERRTKDYRRKFAPTVDDLEYTFNMTNNLTRLAATAGEHPRAVALVLEDIQNLPLDVPFRSFDLLAQRFASFQAAGRASEALAWMRRHRDALHATQRADTTAGAGFLSDSLAIPHRRGVIHLTPFVDRLFPDDPRWTRAGTVRYQRAQAIDRLDRWISAIEKGEALPAP